ncbi:Hypothetical predicted protein [Cloeon dipterum]|uniref:Uncharacterized protein n=1 Tax=Cloeon dipterum TaxID=197152 RepID=A0A8S1E699_9INSE|nr:Hypothetical predicted protein [Cloeon dipterum]
MANRRRGSSDSNSEEVSKLHSLAQLAGISISTRTHSAIVELLSHVVCAKQIFSFVQNLRVELHESISNQDGRHK